MSVTKEQSSCTAAKMRWNEPSTTCSGRTASKAHAQNSQLTANRNTTATVTIGRNDTPNGWAGNVGITDAAVSSPTHRHKTVNTATASQSQKHTTPNSGAPSREESSRQWNPKAPAAYTSARIPSSPCAFLGLPQEIIALSCSMVGDVLNWDCFQHSGVEVLLLSLDHGQVHVRDFHHVTTQFFSKELLPSLSYRQG